MTRHIPNALTILRIILAPVFAAALFLGVLQVFSLQLQGSGPGISAWMLAAAAVFIVAALTDLLDGWAARAWNAESKLGRLLDPIADKLLVGLPLAVYAALSIAVLGVNPLGLLVVVCALVIVLRDGWMTITRLTSPDREGPRVSRLAKIKTALEMVVVGYWPVLYALDLALKGLGVADGEWLPPIIVGAAWVGMLALAAALSVWTGWSYLRPKPVP